MVEKTRESLEQLGVYTSGKKARKDRLACATDSVIIRVARERRLETAENRQQRAQKRCWRPSGYNRALFSLSLSFVLFLLCLIRTPSALSEIHTMHTINLYMFFQPSMGIKKSLQIKGTLKNVAKA